MFKSPGEKFRQALVDESPLQIMGVINAYAAMMAKRVGFKALYLSGAGVANSSYGLPDLGLTTLDNVLEDVRRITQAVDLPLLVDIDTGWGNELMIARTVRLMEQAGAAAVQIEDQVFEKRCGHRPSKAVVQEEEMASRLAAAVQARKDKNFAIMARTDAYGGEEIDAVIKRCQCYEKAGADLIFLEALTRLEEYRIFKSVLSKPILANMTEFGKTPLFTLSELGNAGVDMILYPLSANRAMNLAALEVFQEIRSKGTQLHVLEKMQTREELYGFLNYEKYEKQADQLINRKWS